MLLSLKIQFRLLVLVLPLFVLLLWFVSQQASGRWQQTRQSNAVTEQMTVLVKAVDLVHELQKERGLSAGFLNSQLPDLPAELAQQRALVDLQLQLFLQQLKQQFALSKRQPQLGMALLFIDLDRFKLINDSLGHHVGDAFLIEVSKRLLSTVREHDLVARLGGDEFVVLLSSLAQDTDAEDVAERIIDKVKQPFLLQGQQVFSGASIGIAHYQSDHTKAEALLRDADAAMYHAKALGRGRYAVFQPEMRDQMLKALSN